MIAAKGDDEFYVLRSNDMIEGPPAPWWKRKLVGAKSKISDALGATVSAVIDGLEDALLWWDC